MRTSFCQPGVAQGDPATIEGAPLFYICLGLEIHRETDGAPHDWGLCGCELRVRAAAGEEPVVLCQSRRPRKRRLVCVAGGT